MMLRGSSWSYRDRGSLLSSRRSPTLPTFREYNTGGFRCVLAPSDNAPGLVAWWKADGDARDSAGDRHGTLIGGATFAPGRDGQAFAFNGSTSYVWIPNNPALIFGKDDFTIALWAKFATASSRQAMIACDDGPGPNNKWCFWLYDGALRYHIGTKAPGQGAWLGTLGFAPSADRWFHLTMAKDGSTFRFYINGEEKISERWPGETPQVSAPLTIGVAEGGNYFKGLLDDIRIYSRALSEAEITALSGSQ